jgi:hypothetical protein
MPDGIAAPRRGRSKLLAISPEIVPPKKPKVLVFGPAGVGKTWVSLDFPGVYYFDHEGGADLAHYRKKLLSSGGMYFGPDQGSLEFETVIGQVQALTTEEHPFKTMVFDSATKLFNNAISEESERLGDKDAFGASKKTPVRQMIRLLRWVNKADMNAVFICHEKPLWGKDEKGNREEIGKTFDCWDKLEYELHLTLRISRIGMGDQAKRFANIGKSRLTGFPEGARFGWSYTDFAERYGRDVIERDVKQVVIATPEQVAEINRLLEVVKLPEGETDKWMKAASVETWEEIEADKAEKVIQSLRAKLSAA